MIIFGVYYDPNLYSTNVVHGWDIQQKTVSCDFKVLIGCYNLPLHNSTKLFYNSNLKDSENLEKDTEGD